MKYFSILFLGIFLVLVSSFLGLIIASQNQIGSLKQSTESLELNDAGQLVNIEGDTLYPIEHSGIAKQGFQEYVSLGCAQCHTQQIRREEISNDIERGLSTRFTVPRDYIMQDKTLIGSIRLGPDLIDIASRKKSKDWHYLHLYNPQITSPGSIMPSFPFLFEYIDLDNIDRTENALKFPEGSAYVPKDGIAIIPTRRAEALVEYLLNLSIDYDLPETIIIKNETGKSKR